MSTARYLNAGAPGAGTTIDNMGSRAKAWGCVNQIGTQTIRSSLNVASITDSGVGVTYFNFTALMLNGEYAAFSTGNTAAGKAIRGDSGEANRSAMIMYDSAIAAVDLGRASHIVFGDLA